MYHPTKKWKYYYNFWPRVLFTFNRPSLSPEEQRVLDDLNKTGIATTSCDRLLGPEAFQSLKNEVEKLQTSAKEEIEAARRVASDSKELGVKNYVHFLLGARPELTPENFFVQFALQDAILKISNSYFGMLTKLSQFNIWQTFVTEAEAKESQLWHFDALDRIMIKCFIYLNDVDDSAGPFTYATGTHSKAGKIKNIETLADKPGRSSDEQMIALVPPQKWVKGLGPAGTIIFSDTSGYHKGGLCRGKERVMFECLYASQAARRPGNVKRVPIQKYPEKFEQSFALSPANPKFMRSFRESKGDAYDY